MKNKELIKKYALHGTTRECDSWEEAMYYLKLAEFMYKTGMSAPKLEDEEEVEEWD